MTAHLKAIVFFVEVMFVLCLCFCLGGGFFDGGWWGRGDHGPADPCSYGHYGYEGYGDWGGDEPELDVCSCSDI